MTAVPKPPMTIKQREKLQSRPRLVDRSAAAATFTRDHFTCTWCGVAGGRLDPHHVIRRSQGGKDEVANLRSVHRTCHRYIHEHPLEAKERGFLA